MKRFLLTVVALFSFNLFAEGFHGSTLVSTPGGYKEVRDLREGDEVYSFNENSNCAEARFDDIVVKKIKAVMEVPSERMVKLTVRGSKLHVDAGTKVFSASDNNWILAGDVKEGTLLVNGNFTTMVVDKVEESAVSKAYVVEVEDNHTLYVTNQNILVHNGLIMAIACGIVCKIINAVGCVAGGIIAAGINPGVGVLFATVCAALGDAGVAGCAGVCAAIPGP